MDKLKAAIGIALTAIFVHYWCQLNDKRARQFIYRIADRLK